MEYVLSIKTHGDCMANYKSLNIISLLLILLTATISFAEIDPGIATKPTMKEGYKELDLSQFKDINLNTNPNSNIKIKTSCKSKLGVESHPGEASFESCTAEAQKDRSTGNKNGANQNVEFTLGN